MPVFHKETPSSSLSLSLPPSWVKITHTHTFVVKSCLLNRRTKHDGNFFPLNVCERVTPVGRHLPRDLTVSINTHTLLSLSPLSSLSLCFSVRSIDEQSEETEKMCRALFLAQKTLYFTKTKESLAHSSTSIFHNFELQHTVHSPLPLPLLLPFSLLIIPSFFLIFLTRLESKQKRFTLSELAKRHNGIAPGEGGGREGGPAPGDKIQRVANRGVTCWNGHQMRAKENFSVSSGDVRGGGRRRRRGEIFGLQRGCGDRRRRSSTWRFHFSPFHIHQIQQMDVREIRFSVKPAKNSDCAMIDEQCGV
jgi:hypothetical protein